MQQVHIKTGQCINWKFRPHMQVMFKLAEYYACDYFMCCYQLDKIHWSSYAFPEINRQW